MWCACRVCFPQFTQLYILLVLFHGVIVIQKLQPIFFLIVIRPKSVGVCFGCVTAWEQSYLMMGVQNNACKTSHEAQNHCGPYFVISYLQLLQQTSEKILVFSILVYTNPLVEIYTPYSSANNIFSLNAHTTN